MTIAGSIGTDRKPRQRHSLEDRIKAQDATIERLRAKVNAAVAKRQRIIDAAREAIRQKAAEIEAVK